MSPERGRPIRAKVARILDARSLALNVGWVDGVEVNMLFEILDAKSQDIRDPDTHEVIGSLRRPKIRVRVTRVEEGVCEASTFRSTRVNVGGLGLTGQLVRAFEPVRWAKRHETLRAEDHGVDELDESESLVKIGDPAEQLLTESGEPMLYQPEPKQEP